MIDLVEVRRTEYLVVDGLKLSLWGEAGPREISHGAFIGLSPHLPPPPLQTGSAAWRLADCPEGRIPQGCTALLRFTDDTRRRR